MSIAPIIFFKAGIFDFKDSTYPPSVKPKPAPGYIYLYSKDELMHFCWCPCSASFDEPELDLVMIPSDGSFTPYKPAGKHATYGRVFVLKFSSSAQRYFFWMHPQSQHENGDLSWFSARDRKLGEIVDALLRGEDVNVEHEIAHLPCQPFGNDHDEAMKKWEDTDHDLNQRHGSTSGGVSLDATGGDVRDEGQKTRERGADGERATAPGDPSSVIQDLLDSLDGVQSQSQSQDTEGPSTILQNLLPPLTSVKLPPIESLDETTTDHLLKFLALALPLLVQGNAEEADTDPELAQAALLSLDLAQKKAILHKVIRYPHFIRSLATLIVALRDGGSPSISEAFQIPVANGGFKRRGGGTLRGGDAVEAFLDGIRQRVKKDSSAIDTD